MQRGLIIARFDDMYERLRMYILQCPDQAMICARVNACMPKELDGLSVLTGQFGEMHFVDATIQIGVANNGVCAFWFERGDSDFAYMETYDL